MAKKFLLVLLIAAMAMGAAFAQENAGGEQAKSASVKANWISGEISILGGGLRYERMLGPKLSVGANAYFNSLLLFNDMDVGGFVRFYPWGKTFFVEGQVGFHIYTLLNLWADEPYKVTGVAISPGVGWKVDPGKAGGFFVQPGIRVPITLGVLKSAYSDDDGNFSAAFGVVVYLGLGWAF